MTQPPAKSSANSPGRAASRGAGGTRGGTAPRILVVDDDAAQRDLVSSYLAQFGYRTETANGGADALARLEAGGEAFGLLVSDVRMPDVTGLELLRRVRQRYQHLPVLLITGYADIRDAVDAMRDGALNYLEKPIDLDELRDVVRGVLSGGNPPGDAAGGDVTSVSAADAGSGTGETRKNGSSDAGDRAGNAASNANANANGDDDEVLEPYAFELPDDVVAVSLPMRDALREAALVAPFDSRVLITGESGTGKEVVAQLIHGWSPRRDRPLIRVNCAAIPEKLLESELFGHVKGAFTGATETRIGRFEEAGDGTIFLDEIAEMSPELQAKLLRVTQDGIYQRLGANKDCRTQARLIAATNRDLEVEVAAGRFRDDLFYRLNVIEIHLPPLRERAADVLPLATAFATRFAGGHKPRFSPAVASMLALYKWPGNVRELQNAMERAVLMARGGLILPEHQPRRIQEAVAAAGTAAANAAAADEAAVADAAAGNPGGGTRLQDMEDKVILQTLRENAWNRTETARALGISRRALIYKLRRLSEAGHEVNP